MTRVSASGGAFRPPYSGAGKIFGKSLGRRDSHSPARGRGLVSPRATRWPSKDSIAASEVATVVFPQPCLALMTAMVRMKNPPKRSEERRVGKECRCGWARYTEKTKDRRVEG